MGNANFDSIARPYRWLEYLTLGRALERCRTRHLPHLYTRRRALALGDGDGRFLAALLAANPHLHADAVDTSSAMLQLLHRRCDAAMQAPPRKAREPLHGQSTHAAALACSAATIPQPAAVQSDFFPNTFSTIATRLHTHHTNALNYTPTHPPDLVTAHFFFDCLPQPDLDTLVARLATHTTPETLWLISDFRIPPTGPLRLPARLFLRALYLAFRLLTGLRTTHLPDHELPLTRAGLTRTRQHLSLGGLLTTELWQHTPKQN